MREKVYNDNKLYLWRGTAIVFSVCWIIQFLFVYFYTAPKSFPYILIPNIKFFFISLSFCFSIVLIIKPFFFYIYTFELGAWGFLAIADGFIIDGLLIMILSACFALKAGSFKKHKFLEIFVFLFSILLAYISLYRFGKDEFIDYSIKFLAYLIILAFMIRFLAIGYRTVVSDKRKKLSVSSQNFNESEKLYIQQIVNGTPYKIIEAEYDINISTVKRTATKLCKELNVCNKSELLCRYGEYKIVFE